MLNLNKFGGHGLFTWTHEHLYDVLTSGKSPLVKGLYLKNAFKRVKRSDFVHETVEDTAHDDKDIDLGYGEQLDKPTVIAQMLELINPKLGGKYLDIGTGSGYVTALLGACAGETGKVYSLERVQFLAEIARGNMRKYPDIKNTEIVFKDGGHGLPEYAPYDGIHISVAFAEVPQHIRNQLKVGGKLVVPTVNNDIRMVERLSGEEFIETIHDGFYFKEIESGIA